MFISLSSGKQNRNKYMYTQHLEYAYLFICHAFRLINTQNNRGAQSQLSQVAHYRTAAV